MLWPRLAFGCREKAEALLHSSRRLIDRGGASRLLLQAGPRRGCLPRCRNDAAGRRRLLDQRRERLATDRKDRREVPSLLRGEVAPIAAVFSSPSLSLSLSLSLCLCLCLCLCLFLFHVAPAILAP